MRRSHRLTTPILSRILSGCLLWASVLFPAGSVYADAASAPLSIGRDAVLGIVSWFDCGDRDQACAAPFDPKTGEVSVSELTKINAIRDGVPDQRPSWGPDRIETAWFEQPTDRYPHGALGDPIEGTKLVAQLDDDRLIELTLNDGSVFEDLSPRFADLNGDGMAEILAIAAHPQAGARLSAFSIDAGENLTLMAESQSIGMAYRWLNTIGVADFDGDGRNEIAYIEKPHIGGMLRILGLHDGRLVEEANLAGFSNHAMGSTNQYLAEVVDLEGDGRPEIIVPGMGRRSLHLVRFDGATPEISASIQLSSQIVSGMICDPCTSPVQMHYVDGAGTLHSVSPGW